MTDFAEFERQLRALIDACSETLDEEQAALDEIAAALSDRMAASRRFLAALGRAVPAMVPAVEPDDAATFSRLASDLARTIAERRNGPPPLRS